MTRRSSVLRGSLAVSAVLVVGCSSTDGGRLAGPGPTEEAPGAGGNRDASPPSSDAADPFPVPDWPTGSPESEGLDASALHRAASVAERSGSFCLLVIRHGVLVAENYWNGSDRSTANPSWSLAKSYTGTLVGIAVDRGEITSIDDPVAHYVPEWQGTDRAAITIRHLLSMTSGLSWNAFEDYVLFATLTSDQTSYAVGQSIASTPGTTWTYDNAAVQVLARVFVSATGLPLDEYARAHLWSKIGMKAQWAHDPSGSPTAYANVLATCRDHARLGYLFLHHGEWATARVVSSAYVTDSVTPSQKMNGAYGFLWWVNAAIPAENALMQPWPGRMVSFAPPDLYAARGFGNQFIDVIPSLDMVIVRFGKDPFGQAADGGTADGGIDPGALLVDAKFETHDAILRPILDAVSGE